MNPSRIIFIAAILGSLVTQALYGSDAQGRIVPGSGPDRDTIDFGYLLSGNDGVLLFRSIHFINDGTVDLIVRDTDMVLDTIAPFNSKTDFQYPARFPLHVTTANTIANPLSYDSIEVSSSTFLKDAPQGWNLVQLHVRLAWARSGNADSIVAERKFILRFFKTLQPLWTPPVHSFDSVYVGASTIDSIDLRNTDVKRSAQVLDTISQTLKGESADFVFLNSPLIKLAADSGSKITRIRLRFSPSHIGEDSVQYFLTQINHSALRKDIDSLDSTRVLLRGTGVEQHVVATAVHSKRGSMVGDTIDVGSFTVGAADTSVIVFQNTGNINYRARATMVAISPSDTIPFAILDSLSSETHHVPAGSSDSMRILFHPTREGDFLSRCVFRSDIDQRVNGVPESQKEQIIYLRGHSTPAKLRVLSSELHFSPVVVFDQCPAGRSLSLRLYNSTAATVHVDKPQISPSSAPFSISPDFLDIAPGTEDLFSVKFAPRMVDDFQAGLVLTSTVDDVPIVLRADGSGVAPQTMPLALPSEIRAFPGHAISVPLLVDPALVSLSQIAQFTMTYDSSLLRYDRYDAIGTASAGGQVSVDSHLADQIVVQARVPDVFQSKDTLVRIIFRTTLGYADRCNLSVSSPAFGLDPCASVMPSTSPSTVFLLDSLCGLQSKILSSPLEQFVISDAAPNPASSHSTIVYTVAFKTNVHISLRNSIGEVVQEVCNTTKDEGVYTSDLALDKLADGVYYVTMQAGIYTGTRELVISH